MFDCFLIYDIKNYLLSFIISYIFDILHRITTFSERHNYGAFPGGRLVTSLLEFRVLTSL